MTRSPSSERRPPALVAGPAATTASCAAPDLQMYLFANGDVGPCCRNLSPLGNISRDRLGDIWFGEARRDLRSRLSRSDFTAGCGVCEAELRIEGRAGSTPEGFDHWERTLGRPSDDGLPVRIEFELSNICNLMCVQCNGNISSAIRTRREKRSPLVSPYDDRFLEDLGPFLPNLRHASFTGGEPFLAPVNYSVWAMLSETNPDVAVTIVTNGTVWNDRVAGVLADLVVQPVVSLDGITARVYEAVRIGADHQAVLENVERFADYARTRGTTLNINMCLMPQTVRDFPRLIHYAEQRGIFVNPQIVRSPAQFSLAHVSVAELASIHAELMAWDRRFGADLVTNAAVWRTELARLEAWIGGEPASDRPGRWARDTPKILMFPRHAAGPMPSVPPVPESGGDVIDFRVGTDERICDPPEALAALLDMPLTDVDGGTLDILWRVVSSFEVTHEDHHRYVAAVTLADGTAATFTLRADRDAAGTASGVHASLRRSRA